MEKKKKIEPDFELCGNCGAVLDKDSLFCKRCGVKLEPKQELKDSAESAEEPDKKSVCRSCGAELDGDSRFCVKCGVEVVARQETPLEEEQKAAMGNACVKCGAALNDGDKFCQNCGAKIETPIEPKAPVKRFCRNCGTEFAEGTKFCHKCGSPVGAAAATAPSPAAVPAKVGNSNVDAATAKKRKIAAILALVGSSISILLVFIFLCTPFISVSVELMGISTGSVSQSGLGLIGVMFGGDSNLNGSGVSMPLLRFAGWLYAALLLAIINHAVCLVINVFRYLKGERPVNLFASNLAILIAALGALVVGIIARVQIGDSFYSYVGNSSYASLSCYLGFVAVFVFAAVGFACVATSYGFYYKAYAPLAKGERKKGSALAILLTDLVCGVLIALAIIAPLVNMFDYNNEPEITVHVGDKGQAQTECYDDYNDVKVGTTVFLLEDAERYGSYTFTIKTDGVSESVLSSALTLVYYTQVEGETPAEICDSLSTAEVDFDYDVYSGSNSATISFTNESYRTLAVVVAFVSASDDTVKYDYSFEIDDSYIL